MLLLYMLKEVFFRINFWYMSKDDAINIMNGSNLIDKKGVLQKNFIITFFVIYKNELEY